MMIYDCSNQGFEAVAGFVPQPSENRPMPADLPPHKPPCCADRLPVCQANAGPRGFTGPKGDKGEKGDKGDTGAQGVQGLKGDKGDTGAQGIQGVKGDKGDTGTQGIQGLKGDKGDTGAQGVQGVKGDKGDTGAQGIQGIQGEKGDKGDKGEQGEKGTASLLYGTGMNIKDDGTVANNATLIFDNQLYSNNPNISLNDTTGEITITKSGNYLLLFDLNIDRTVAGATKMTVNVNDTDIYAFLYGAQKGQMTGTLFTPISATTPAVMKIVNQSGAAVELQSGLSSIGSLVILEVV